MEATIGYDLRLARPDPAWTPDRQAVYLLRPDVTAVRSVDSIVWECPPGLPPLPLGQPLWADLAGLRATARGLDQAAVVTVCVTALTENREPQAEGTNAESPPGTLLGYDVADEILLSGLANCGYTAAERASLAPHWAPRLNQWHLFDTPADATEFADITSARVPEHAPFYAYGLYRADGPSPSPQRRHMRT